jgi:toxin ParE1/3/4
VSYIVYLRPEAENDIREASKWYQIQQENLGHQFLDEIVSALTTLQESPEIYPIIEG